MAKCDALVAGVGEIGEPLAQLLAGRWKVDRIDLHLQPEASSARVIHVCYPYQIEDFLGTTHDYIQRFEPDLVIVHSTVIPGTTDELAQRSDALVAYSPVRGKHAQMSAELRHYTKFVAGSESAQKAAAAHLAAVGLSVELFGSPSTLEMAKLIETSFFGMLIAWAQETERLAESVGANYESVARFTEEVSFLPSNYHPGFIGGHCVIPNIDLIARHAESDLLMAVKRSNDRYASSKGCDE